jgi:ABC-2 type transport system permease protein/lipopolysaccharide transport system permease protein
MSVESSIPAAPPPELRFRRKISPGEAMRELWQTRDFVRALVERQLRSRYKQAFLGVAWALIPPVVTMVVLTLVVQNVVTIDTKGIPYPLFSYVALLPWNFFSTSVSVGTGSLLGAKDLLNKVYVPREAFPVASTITAAIDSAISLLALAILFAVYLFVPKPTVVWVPLLFTVQVAFTLGVTLIMSSLVVYLRDLRHALPLIIQLGLFATPIIYGMDSIPPHLRVLYSALNPLGPIIDGYRRVVLFGQAPAWDLMLPATLTAFFILGIGFIIFKRLETGFTDVV